MRFDVPVVGVPTIETMIEAGATCLCITAGKTLMFDRDEMIRAGEEEQDLDCGGLESRSQNVRYALACRDDLKADLWSSRQAKAYRTFEIGDRLPRFARLLDRTARRDTSSRLPARCRSQFLTALPCYTR